MSSSISNKNNWSKWHDRLHQKLLANPSLLPKGSLLLLSVSGGQDSISLLQLILDLKRLHEWKLEVWHGNHRWHKKSDKVANELFEWCQKRKIFCFCENAATENTKTEALAREWRYQSLVKRASEISNKSKEKCKHVLTGHTCSDRAETFLFNLSRGSDLAGLSSLNESRPLNEKVELIRPILCFSREETAQICKELNLPIWIDPTNNNQKYNRNRIRKEIIPVLESINPGCSLRISALAERISHNKENQKALAIFIINAIQTEQGLSREKLIELPANSRVIVLAWWLKEEGIPNISSMQLEEISYRIDSQNPPGSLSLPSNWKVNWSKDFVKLSNLKKHNLTS